MKKIQPYYKQNEPEKTKRFWGRGSSAPPVEILATSGKDANNNCLNSIRRVKEKVQKTT